MGVFDFLFGGTDTSSQDAQIAANQQATELIRQQAEAARRDVLNIFPASEFAQQQGFQAAANLFGESIPEQARVLDIANQRAQQAQTQGLAGFREAILGLPQDFSQQFLQQGIQPLTPSFGFQRQNLQLPRTFFSDELGIPAQSGVEPLPTPIINRQTFTGEGGFEDVDLLQPQPVTQPTIRTKAATENLGSLVDQLLADESRPLLDRANIVFDEAARLGLSPEQLAASTTSLTLEDVLAGLQQTGRTL